MAVLDERFMRQLAPYPQLSGRLFGRAVGRSRQLIVNLAIVHQARVDIRLHMLLWHLAGRWGRVRSDGVLVPLRLTHTILSDLVAARRPTVTSALSELARRGVVRAVEEGWLLSGNPPGELPENRHGAQSPAIPRDHARPLISVHIDPYIVLGSAIIGLLVGMTGAGGGALMTPMLILLFGVKPSTAISVDLVAAVVMRPIGAAVHMRAGTVNLKLVRWMVLGSVPVRVPRCLPAAPDRQRQIGREPNRGLPRRRAADRRRRHGAAVRAGPPRPATHRTAFVTEVHPRPLLTLAIGIVGGIIVGMTSVGSGSLMIVGLLFIYPTLGANQLVGTDLTQAVPLTLAAALGALAFGHVEFSVTGSLILGSVPAVLVGSLLSSTRARSLRAPGDRVRDLRLGPEVRRHRHDRAGLDPVRDPAGRRRDLARRSPARGRRCRPADPGRRRSADAAPVTDRVLAHDRPG